MWGPYVNATHQSPTGNVCTPSLCLVCFRLLTRKAVFIFKDCFKNKKVIARSGKIVQIIFFPPMSFRELPSFRLISQYNNFLCVPAVFRSDQQTASLTSFLSEEVIKWTAVHRLTIPAALTPQLPWKHWRGFAGAPCLDAFSAPLRKHLRRSCRSNAASSESSIKTPFFLFWWPHHHSSSWLRGLVCNQPQTGMSYCNRQTVSGNAAGRDVDTI